MSLSLPKPSSFLKQIVVKIYDYGFDFEAFKLKASAQYLSAVYFTTYINYFQFGTTSQKIVSTQQAENGTQTTSYVDNIEGVQLQDSLLSITYSGNTLNIVYDGHSSHSSFTLDDYLITFPFKLFAKKKYVKIFVQNE